MRLDPDRFAAVVAGTIKAAISGLTERVKALEDRGVIHGKDGEKGEKGDSGRDGKDADTSVIESLRAEIAALRAELAEKKAAAVPVWVPPDVDALVAAAVEKAVTAIPKPQDGRDGIGLAGALIDRAGQLVMTLSDGSTKELGAVVGSSVNLADVERFIKSEMESWPKPADGKDGLGFEDVDFYHDEIGRAYARFSRGEITKSVRLPGIVYRDLWDATVEYEPGDATTWDGSMWTAKQANNGIAPGSLQSKGVWALSVMRGRQGKPGGKGDTGEKGMRGEIGPRGPAGY